MLHQMDINSLMKDKSKQEKKATGPNTPPNVPNNGLIAFSRGGYIEPPGETASVISFTAKPKKKHMKISFTMKCVS